MRFALPMMPSLLLKELIELAALRRTYILRTLYALGLFVVFMLTSYRQFAHLEAGDMQSLGAGGPLFDALVFAQFWGVYLFMPLLVAPLVTEEDERGSLDILLVSGISPLAFLVQKLASRLICMGSFLLLALPIGGIAFAMGGVDPRQLVTGAISLLLCCLQVSSVALWCSARAHTSIRAVGSAYLLGSVMLFIAMPVAVLLPLLLAQNLAQVMGMHQVTDLFILPSSWYFDANRRHYELGQILFAGLPIALSALGFMALAWRAMLRRRMTISPITQRQLRIYRPGLIFELRRRQRVVKMGTDAAALPDEQPLAWREIRRTPGFRVEHRSWLWVGLPLLIGLGLLIAVNTNSRDAAGLASLMQFIYVVAIPLIAVIAAGLISGERMRNSLEILLVTPLTSRALLTEKLAGCSRLAWTMLALIALFAALTLVTEVSVLNRAISWWRLPVTLLTAWLYFQLTMWMAMAVSLRLRVQTQATVTILGIIAAWVVLPLLAVQVHSDLTHQDMTIGWWSLLSYLSPVSAITDRGTDLPVWRFHMLVNLGWHGVILWLVRRHCLRHADTLLGRTG